MCELMNSSYTNSINGWHVVAGITGGKRAASIVACRHMKSQNPKSFSGDKQVSASHGLLFPVT